MPMAPELLERVQQLCERLPAADAARLLCLLDPRIRSAVDQAELQSPQTGRTAFT